MTNSKRSVMTLYSDATNINSHRVRIVLAEKGINVDVLHINPEEFPEDLASLNPYQNLPTLVDRELVLHESGIIAEYLDERFPHPPLLPVYPIARARCRLTMHRVEKDLCSKLAAIDVGNAKEIEQNKQELSEYIISLSPILSETPYFMSEDFSLLDCHLAPLLLRLPQYGITIPSKTQSLRDYAKRVFERPSFQASLSDQERELLEQHDLK